MGHGRRFAEISADSLRLELALRFAARKFLALLLNSFAAELLADNRFLTGAVPWVAGEIPAKEFA
jgi:hypothetical protein